MRLLFLLFILSTSCLPAQSGSHGSVEITVNTEDSYGDSKRTNLLYRAPATDPASIFGYREPKIGGSIIKALVNGTMPAFRDADLQQPLSVNEIRQTIFRPDTIQVINYDTYESTLQVVVPELNPADFSEVKLNVSFTYNEKNGIEQSVNSGSVSYYPLTGDEEQVPLITIYFPVENSNKPPKLKKENIVDFYRINVDKEDISPSKTPIDNAIENIMKNLRAGIDTDGFRSNGNYEAMNQKSLQRIVQSSDTIVIINPDTYESEDRIVATDLGPDNVDHLRLLQYWSWSEKKQRLTVHPAGYGLMSSQYGDEQKLLYRIVLVNWLSKRFR